MDLTNGVSEKNQKKNKVMENRTTWDVRDIKINTLKKENEKLRNDNAKLLAYIEVLQGQINRSHKTFSKMERKEKIKAVPKTFTQKIESIYQGFIKWLNT
jgi:predicted RNase H-like nuclease (RuvC/YqgF family)